MCPTEKRNTIDDLEVLDVDPDTEYTLEILQDAINRIASRKDKPNIVYNILFEALGKLVPRYSTEECQRHMLQAAKPDMSDGPDPNKMYATDQVEDLVALLVREEIANRTIQDALLNAFIRRLTANPYRDPIDVKAVEDDYLYLERTTARLRDLMEQLYKALNRAASTQRAMPSED